MLEKMETKSFCQTNASLFTRVNDTLGNTTNINDDIYNCLDYEKILNTMCEFIDGYFKYLESGENKYDGSKIVDITITFYDKMFDDKENRKEITLKEFSDINETFLEKTNQLQTLFEKCRADVADNHNRTSEQLYQLSNRQYRKLARVYHDDMKLVLWLRDKKVRGCRYGSDACYDPGDEAIHAFHDKSTPVIHEGVIER